jgi:hypothetical protein
VVFWSEVFELIQYAPQTDQVWSVPLLMVPPVINKFYIMDIAPGRILIEYFLRQGMQVFAISWRNPTTPLPMEINPRIVFERLFGRPGTNAQRLERMAKDRSILDSVKQDVADLEASLGPRDRNRLGADPRFGGPAAAIAEDDGRHAVGGRGHRMTVEQQRATEAAGEDCKLRLERFVIGPVRLAEALVELPRSDRAPPQIAVLLGAGGNDPEPAAGARADPAAAGAVDNGRIDLFLGAVAIDGGARRPGDDRATATLQRAPYQPVDQRILEHRKRRLAARREARQPVRIVATRVRDGQQDGEIAARFMDDWGGELAHGVKVKFRASLGLAEGPSNA